MKQDLNILLVDNYDSFSYNLVELLRQVEGVRTTVLKNDDLGIFRDCYDAVIISPGPGLPSESAFLMDAIDYYVGRLPILGICLGLQAIVEHYGGKLQQLNTVFHGIRDEISHDGKGVLFAGLPPKFMAGRYHSWVSHGDYHPENLVVTARDQHGFIMATEYSKDSCYAVQFHPESFMTPDGIAMLKNFIALVHAFHNSKAEVNLG